MEEKHKIIFENAVIFLFINKSEEDIKKFLGIEKVIFPNQIHSSRIMWFERSKDLNCDGILTKEKNCFVGVKTADCVPLLIYNKNFVGALHCGWRGLSNGILENLSKILKEESAYFKDLKYFLGPSIGKCCYDVKEDVGNLFAKFYNNGKLDLKGFIVNFLLENKVLKENIEINEICTFCNKSFPSYRREKSKGRILTGIYLNK